VAGLADPAPPGSLSADTAVLLARGTIEIEVIDSLTGDRLAALIQPGQGRRPPATWEDVEAYCAEAATTLRQIIGGVGR